MVSLAPWFGGGGRRQEGTGWDIFPSPSESWDPFGFGGGLSWGRSGRDQGDEVAAIVHANVDWRETDNAHIFKIDIPGVSRADLKVQVEDANILQISGERTKEEEHKDDKWHRVERCRGTFVRRFRLPDNADAENIKCGLENGVLTAVVPKKLTQVPERNVRNIDIA